MRNKLPPALLILFFTLSVPGQTAPPPAREHFAHADVQYGWVTNHRGEKLRTFITRPHDIAGKVPVIFFVGWLSCDSMEYPDPATRDGFGILIRRLIGCPRSSCPRLHLWRILGTHLVRAHARSRTPSFDGSREVTG